MMSKTRKRKVADNYLDFLSEGKTKELVSLFAEAGKVLSPIYGEKPAALFYEELNADTQNSELKFKGIFEEADSNRFALFFNYGWKMANGHTSNFDVVDIFELNEEGKILQLQIIYNAVESAQLIKKNKPK